MLIAVGRIWFVVLIAWAACFPATALRADEADDQFAVAAGHYDRGRWKLAVEEFRTFAEKYPNDRRANQCVFFLGEALLQLGQFDEARRHFQNYAGREPEGKYARVSQFRSGEASYLAGDFQTARPDLERFLAKYPSDQLNAFVLPYLGEMALGKNDAEAAVGYFRDALKRFPDGRLQADCRTGLARALLKLAQRALDGRDYGRASGLVDELLAANPDPPLREHAMYLRGQIAVAKTDWPQAREAFEALVKEFPETKRRLAAEFWVAEAYYRQADYKAAAARLERLAEQITPENRESWMAIVPLRQAQSLAKQDQWNEAHAIAAQIEKDYPDFEQQYEVDYLIGRCLANRADFEAARRAYNKAIRSAAGAKTETAAMAQWMIGETFFHQKNYQAAVREYLRLEILYPYPTWQAAALLEAGKCHQRLGEATQAAELYQRILKVYPHTPFAEQAAQRLTALEKKKTS